MGFKKLTFVLHRISYLPSALHAALSRIAALSTFDIRLHVKVLLVISEWRPRPCDFISSPMESLKNRVDTLFNNRKKEKGERSLELQADYG